MGFFIPIFIITTADIKVQYGEAITSLLWLKNDIVRISIMIIIIMLNNLIIVHQGLIHRYVSKDDSEPKPLVDETANHNLENN